MSHFKVLPVGVLCCCVGLTGCFHTTRIVQKTQAPDVYRTASVQELERELSARAAAL